MFPKKFTVSKQTARLKLRSEGLHFILIGWKKIKISANIIVIFEFSLFTAAAPLQALQRFSKFVFQVWNPANGEMKTVGEKKFWNAEFLEFQKGESSFYGCTSALILQNVLSQLSLQHILFPDLPTQLPACESHDFWQLSHLAALVWNSKTLKTDSLKTPGGRGVKLQSLVLGTRNKTTSEREKCNGTVDIQVRNSESVSVL